MKPIRLLLPFLLVALLMGGCSRYREVVDTNFATGGKDLAVVEAAVKTSLKHFNWQVIQDEKGLIVARYDKAKHYVLINIKYSDSKVDISYLKSEGLRYKEVDGKRMIHKRYNQWIANLQRRIEVELNPMGDPVPQATPTGDASSDAPLTMP